MKSINFSTDGTCAVGLKIDDRRNRYENGIDFLYDYLAADVCAGMSGFSRSTDDTENPVYLQAGWQLRNLHDESGWLRRHRKSCLPPGGMAITKST